MGTCAGGRAGEPTVGSPRRPRGRLVHLLALTVAATGCAGSGGEPTAEDDPGTTAAATIPDGGSTDPGDGITDSADRTDEDLARLIRTGPGPEYGSALDDRFGSRFPDPLVDPDRIRSGGPPPDGIPPIDHPEWDQVDDVDWLEDDEPVLALTVDGDARAYPVQIMTWHEIVNDEVAGIPVTVSFCPLCNSAVAFDRRVHGEVLDFGTSGLLHNSSLVMYDRQTESLWTHFDGRAVVGALTGTRLDLLPLTTVSWRTFREAHPDGLVQNRLTGHNRPYGRNPYPGYDDPDGEPFLFDGDRDERLPAQTRVVALRGDDNSVVIPLDDLAEQRTIETAVDGESVVVLHRGGTASALDTPEIADGRDVGETGAFRTEVKGRTVTLVADGDGPDTVFVDETSGTTFDLFGTGTGGELDGLQLEPVEHLDTFWFAIAAFDPSVEVQRANG